MTIGLDGDRGVFWKTGELDDEVLTEEELIGD